LTRLLVVTLAAAAACAGVVVACAQTDNAADAPPPEASDDVAAVAAPAAADSGEGAKAPAAKEDPLAGITGDASLAFAGEEALLSKTPAARVDVVAVDLACLPDGRAAAEPASVLARLDEVAAEQGVALGRLRVVRYEAHPGQDPKALRACRPVAKDAAIFAPLFRVKEPPAAWRIALLEGAASAEAVTAFIDEVMKGGGKPVAPPRLVVVREEIVAVALPVSP
jgi:hypothetical protein